MVIAFFSGINDRLFVTLSIKQISNFFVKIFECISIKLPWKLPSVIYLWIQCYNERFQVSPTSACIFVKILKDIEISKVTVHVNFFGKFLRSGAEMLGKTIHEMCNLLISLYVTWCIAKWQNLGQFLKRVRKLTLQIINQLLCYSWSVTFPYLLIK